MRKVKLTFRPNIDRVRITFPETKGTDDDGKPVPLVRSGKGDMIVRPGETVAVTTDERDYLRENHKELLPELLRFSVPATVNLEQVEIPETDGEDEKGKPLPVCRSRAGAIHVRPNSTLQITSDERDLLKRFAPSLFSQLLPLRAQRPPDAALRAATRSTEPPPTSSHSSP